MRAWGTAATFVVLLAGSLGLIAHTMF